MFFHKRLIVGLHDLLHDKLLQSFLIGIEVVQNTVEVSSSLLDAYIVDIR